MAEEAGDGAEEKNKYSGDGVVLGEMQRRGTWHLSGQGNKTKKKNKSLERHIGSQMVALVKGHVNLACGR